MGTPVVCPECEATIVPLEMGDCWRCGSQSEGPCQACNWMLQLDWLRAPLPYRGTAGVAVRKLKYSFDQELVAPLASFVEPLLDETQSVNVIVPVPIHWSRRSYRGFNQSELLANQAFRGSGIKINGELLLRSRATAPQARLSLAQRQANLVGAFRCQSAPPERVLLVDDVVTSGATLEECARTLKEAGTRFVGAVTVAREAAFKN